MTEIKGMDNDVRKERGEHRYNSRIETKITRQPNRNPANIDRPQTEKEYANEEIRSKCHYSVDNDRPDILAIRLHERGPDRESRQENR
jgi:hypothetical protein